MKRRTNYRLQATWQGWQIALIILAFLIVMLIVKLNGQTMPPEPPIFATEKIIAQPTPSYMLLSPRLSNTTNDAAMVSVLWDYSGGSGCPVTVVASPKGAEIFFSTVPMAPLPPPKLVTNLLAWDHPEPGITFVLQVSTNQFNMYAWPIVWVGTNKTAAIVAPFNQFIGVGLRASNYFGLSDYARWGQSNGSFMALNFDQQQLVRWTTQRGPMTNDWDNTVWSDFSDVYSPLEQASSTEMVGYSIDPTNGDYEVWRWEAHPNIGTNQP